MKKIKIISFFSVLLLVSTHLSAMMENDDYIIDQRKVNYSKKSPSQLKKNHEISSHKQKLSNREKQESSNNYAPKPLSCWVKIWPYWENISHIWKELLGYSQSNAKAQGTNIYLLPSEILWHIADFLDSVDVLKLSSTCKKFRQIFNDDYWNTYLSRAPKAHSYLTLKGPLSPSLNRKAFFSHLWYSEGRISLAARLYHPEALMLRDYGIHGAYIGKDQYLCPSGFIRHVSGRIDNEKTDKLKDAERKKIRTDMQRNEMLKERQKVYSDKIERIYRF